MGLMTTILLVFFNLLGSLIMGWWALSAAQVIILFILLGLGSALFYAEEISHRLAWRGHLAYWALSLINVVWLYWMTRASGWLLLLLVINVMALLRALSRLDAQASGIAYPVTFEGRPVKDCGRDSSKSKLAGFKNDINEKHDIDERQVIIDDQPDVQVELETYKDGQNAVPIVNSSGYDRDIDDLMKRVKADLKREKLKSKTKRISRPRVKHRKRKGQRK